MRDAKALARAIARLQDEPALAGRLGQAAREKALTKFDERLINAQTSKSIANRLGVDKVRRESPVVRPVFSSI